MEKAKQFKSYTDFLQDKIFILWILTGSPKLGQYWKSILDEHPEYTSYFNEAIRHSANIKLNQSRMSDEELQTLRQRIHASSTVARSKKSFQIWLWCIASLVICAILALLIIR